MLENCAIISDTMGNEEALRAVLSDIKNENITKVICLGGICIGPRPVAVLDLVRKSSSICLKSSYEEALTGSRKNLNPVFIKAVDWVDRSVQEAEAVAFESRLAWLASRKPIVNMDGYLLAHGDPKIGTFGHIPCPSSEQDSIPDWEIASLPFSSTTRIIVGGLLGRQFIIRENGEASSARSLGNTCTIPSENIVVCPGAVGRPMDRDHRAGYLIIRRGTFTWKRIEYDNAYTATQAEAIPELVELYIPDRIRIGI